MDNQQRAKDQERLAFTHSEKKQTNKQTKQNRKLWKKEKILHEKKNQKNQ